MSNATDTVAFGVILTTGGSDTAIETESIEVFVTPHLPEYNLPARIFQRRADKQGENWTEPAKNTTEPSTRLKDELVISTDGVLESWTPAVQRMLQGRLLAVDTDYSGAFLVPLSSEDIDALQNVTFPELPESTIAKAIEIMGNAR